MKAAIFDMDGTIIDSMWIWHDVDVEYSRKYNHEVTHEELLAIASMSFNEAAAYIKEITGSDSEPDEIREELFDMARELYKTKVTLKPYVIEYIKHLRDNGVKTAIATAAASEFADIIVEKFDLGQYFDVILTSADVKYGKREDPEIYLKCSTLLGVSPSDTAVFEDALHAATTASKAGYQVIGIHDIANRHCSESFDEICHRTITCWSQMMN